MPIYEYECTSCGERLEIHRQIFDGDTEITCPNCGAKHPRRIYSTFASRVAPSSARDSLGGSCEPSRPT